MMNYISKSESTFFGLYRNELLGTEGRKAFFKLDDLQCIYNSETIAGVFYNCNDYTIFSLLESQDSQRNMVLIKLNKKSLIQTKIYEYPFDEQIYKIFYDDEILFFYDTLKQVIFAQNFENKVLWSYSSTRWPQIVYKFNDILIITYHNGQDLLTALNINTGKELWRFEVEKELDYDLTLTVKPVILNQNLKLWNDFVIFSAGSWGMVSLNVFTGKTQWKQKGSNFSVIFDNYGYNVSEESITEYDLRNGSLIRTKDINDYGDGLTMSMREILFYVKDPTVTQKNIFFGGKDYVFSVDRKTFDLVQILKIDASGGVYSDQTYYDGHIYILDYYNYLHKIKDLSAK